MSESDNSPATVIDITDVVDFIEKTYGGDWCESAPDDLSGEFCCLPFEKCVFMDRLTDNSVDVEKLTYDEGVGISVYSHIPIDGSLRKVSVVARLTSESTFTIPPKICFLLDDGFDDALPKLDSLHGEELTNMQTLFALSFASHYAMWLMGWKREVELREPKITRQMRRQSERTGVPITLSKRLCIETWKQRFLAIRGESSSERLGPAFLVRGHRTTYTASRPMFGCHLCMGEGHQNGMTPHVGTFWTTPHFVGDKVIGTIHHEYAVAI